MRCRSVSTSSTTCARLPAAVEGSMYVSARALEASWVAPLRCPLAWRPVLTPLVSGAGRGARWPQGPVVCSVPCGTEGLHVPPLVCLHCHP